VNDLENGTKPREFTFDHAFWSHDDFTIDDTGYNTPNANNKYTDQKKVWNLLGTSMLEKAWKGLNNTIFAYGQTGAGKSYSIFGYPGNAGIIPMAATELFVKINAETDPAIRYEVSVQMVEIYMEKIQDLLVASNKRGNPLPIKQNKAGVYVQGATKTPVSNYADIQRVIDKGEGNRTIGATQMNQTSSRSHTVVTIYFQKIT
jgi:kinesin family protein 1